MSAVNPMDSNAAIIVMPSQDTGSSWKTVALVAGGVGLGLAAGYYLGKTSSLSQEIERGEQNQEDLERMSDATKQLEEGMQKFKTALEEKTKQYEQLIQGQAKTFSAYQLGLIGAIQTSVIAHGKTLRNLSENDLSKQLIAENRAIKKQISDLLDIGGQ